MRGLKPRTPHRKKPSRAWSRRGSSRRALERALLGALQGFARRPVLRDTRPVFGVDDVNEAGQYDGREQKPQDDVHERCTNLGGGSGHTRNILFRKMCFLEKQSFARKMASLGRPFEVVGPYPITRV